MSRLLCKFDGKKFLFIGKNIPPENQLVCDCEIYNFDELNNHYKIKSANHKEILYKLIKLKGVLSALEEVDGLYSLAYFDGSHVSLARDIIGLKPLWYSLSKGLVFSSVKDDIVNLGYKDIKELNPRKVLSYDVKDSKVSLVDRSFFSIKPQLAESEDVIVKNLLVLFSDSVKKRIPKKKFGISFSGGIDSTLIAFVCKKLGLDFTCYTSYFYHPGMADSQDLICAKKVAKSLGFKLKCIGLDIAKTESVLKRIVPLLGPDIVKVGVALPFFAACEQASKDGCEVIFSGLGSEELFAGYLRHKLSSNINEECLSGLLNMHERDTYRDYLVAGLDNMEVETPFLDKFLIDYSLKIPPDLKLKDGVEKFIIRQVALSLGIPEEFAFRKKKAAQYGSNFDKALGKLAKKNGFKLKADYLKTF